VIALRNVVIIALLALGLTVLPGGGNVATAIITALSLIFLAAIGLLLARVWRESSLTRDVMSDRQRTIVYGSLGALALMIAGLDELLDTGGGTVAWLVIVAVSVYLLVTTWREVNSY
jgi:hypothetical protein